MVLKRTTWNVPFISMVSCVSSASPGEAKRIKWVAAARITTPVSIQRMMWLHAETHFETYLALELGILSGINGVM
jgi:hypothetical protein